MKSRRGLAPTRSLPGGVGTFLLHQGWPRGPCRQGAWPGWANKTSCPPFRPPWFAPSSSPQPRLLAALLSPGSHTPRVQPRAPLRSARRALGSFALRSYVSEPYLIGTLGARSAAVFFLLLSGGVGGGRAQASKHSEHLETCPSASLQIKCRRQKQS